MPKAEVLLQATWDYEVFKSQDMERRWDDLVGNDAAKRASDPAAYEAQSAITLEFATTALIEDLRRKGRMKYHEHLEQALAITIACMGADHFKAPKLRKKAGQ